MLAASEHAADQFRRRSLFVTIEIADVLEQVVDQRQDDIERFDAVDLEYRLDEHRVILRHEVTRVLLREMSNHVIPEVLRAEATS